MTMKTRFEYRLKLAGASPSLYQLEAKRRLFGFIPWWDKIVYIDISSGKEATEKTMLTNIYLYEGATIQQSAPTTIVDFGHVTMGENEIKQIAHEINKPEDGVRDRLQLIYRGESTTEYPK